MKKFQNRRHDVDEDQRVVDVKRTTQIIIKSFAVGLGLYLGIFSLGFLAQNQKERQEFEKLQSLINGVNYQGTVIKLMLGGYSMYGKPIQASVLGTESNTGIVFQSEEVRYYPIIQNNKTDVYLPSMAFKITTTKVKNWSDKYLSYTPIGNYNGVEILYSGSYPFLINQLPSEITLTIQEFRRNRIPINKLFYLDQIYPEDPNLLKNTQQLIRDLPEITYHNQTGSVFMSYSRFIHLPEDMKSVLIRVYVDRVAEK
ncbi:MAG: hypothetical protein NZ908_01665 [Candidatus Micrarchaeota archaeon]|nr:hypothetical protein [Candidatus Micrarchaeota archaeon]MCX8154417.1 hypothetical protein [Candidatus Micrarchaeota archaeon]